MKVIVDIKNKTLKMLENERSIFKGEYSADKLELYINKQLENEYPVITGLLSNGRRIGAFTTDDGYEVETIDGVEYTKAKFTLSKENGFTLSEGVMQITVWIYHTKDTTIVSKEAIGNITFNVVNTTAFNDGDIIISGDVEGTVVNLKVELENLQGRLEQYLPLSGAKAMTGDLSMEGNNIIFDNDNEETIEIGEEDDEYSMSIRMEDSDYYKGRYRASGFSVGNESINATLDISESKFEMSLKDGGQTSMTPDGFNVSKNGNSTFYEQDNITYYTDNFSKEIKNIFPNESGTIALKEKSLQKKGDKMADNLDMNGYDIQKAFNVQVSYSLAVGNSISIGDFKFRDMSNSDNALQIAIPQDKSLNFREFYNNYWGNGVRIDTSKKALIPINALLTKYTLGTSDDQWESIWGKTIYQNGKQVATTDQLFNRDYRLLTNTPTIPTRTSQLTNNSGYITKAVNNLTNYYLKSDTYTKDEVQQLLSTINSLKLEVVTNLPTTNISSNTIYLKPLDSTKENNIYEEYIYINSKWETIGTTAVDLTNYALKEDIPTKISELEQDVELGVSEEDVMDIIENNAEQTDTLDIGTSATFDATSDEQIPTTKAVQEMINVGGGSGGESVPLAVEITYSELKALRDNSNLVAGQQYRITDFVTTTIQSETKSAEHQFDIIVVADSKNTLNENARAVQHEGDTYFAESNLSAWELKYDLDNDTTKYAWADEVNGKGVIYWLKDEFKNECPYDFKNIQFIRESFIDEDNGITFTNIYFYTFSAYDYLESSGIQSDIQDASIITKKESLDDYYNFCVCNIIKPYFNDVGSIEDPLNILNDIIFINIYSLDDQSYFTCYSNTFGNDCYRNTFGNDCYSNTFGNDCGSNTFGNDCGSNTFGNSCGSNTFGNSCYSNTFGNDCGSNTFGNSCYRNTFGNDCYSNTFGDNCYSNTFGDNCDRNTFGNSCGSNTFGNSCGRNTFTQGYCQYIFIENGCSHLEITSDDTEAEYGNFIQNIHIHQGVYGDRNKSKVITVARNLDYETNVVATGSITIEV